MKEKVLKRANNLWVENNSTLRKKYYEKYNTEEERNKLVPKGVRTKDWGKFVDLQRKPSVIAHRNRGKNARKAMKSPHTIGRRGTGRTTENMEKINNVLATNPEDASLDVDHDPVEQVCGKDKNGYARGCGFGVTRDELLSSSHLWDQLHEEQRTRLSLEEDMKQKLLFQGEAIIGLEETIMNLTSQSQPPVDATMTFTVLRSKLAFGFFLGGGALDIPSYYFSFLQWLFMFFGL
ncbi:hypothetical protein GIB67_039884 [Kingdonia uniflora]|uniref:Uncharacterized protein n=1 Tax=Kingdonia uniflora TaxID=39325 RepID=A0A7J7P3P1_9MAGN|nr:hypothetical protein GIB67_039884 [Kingdonia uniflora]